MQPQDPHAAAPAPILIIDDDPALLTTLTRILDSEGFVVHAATDGAAGLAHVREQCPALVLLDLHMPTMDGYAFLDAFRAIPECAEVPVILMTGSQDTATPRRRIPPQRVVLLLSKPFDLGTLLAAVRGASAPRRGQGS